MTTRPTAGTGFVYRRRGPETISKWRAKTLSFPATPRKTPEKGCPKLSMLDPQGEPPRGGREADNAGRNFVRLQYPKETPIVVCARFEQCNIVFSLGVRGYPKESTIVATIPVLSLGVSVRCTTSSSPWGSGYPQGNNNVGLFRPSTAHDWCFRRVQPPPKKRPTSYTGRLPPFPVLSCHALLYFPWGILEPPRRRRCCTVQI